MIQNRDRRYLLQTPCSAELQEVGFAQGKVFWLDDGWYEKLGNTLLRVDIKAGPAPISRSCLGQRIWLPVMTSED